MAARPSAILLRRAGRIAPPSADADAAFANSAAFGNGATATRANQQVFGTVSNTYTMSGLTSNASKQTQGSPTHLVTSNSSGDLAAFTVSQLGLASTGDISELAVEDQSPRRS